MIAVSSDYPGKGAEITVTILGLVALALISVFLLSAVIGPASGIAAFAGSLGWCWYRIRRRVTR